MSTANVHYTGLSSMMIKLRLIILYTKFHILPKKCGVSVISHSIINLLETQRGSQKNQNLH